VKVAEQTMTEAAEEIKSLKGNNQTPVSHVTEHGNREVLRR